MLSWPGAVFTRAQAAAIAVSLNWTVANGFATPAPLPAPAATATAGLQQLDQLTQYLVFLERKP